METDDLKHLVKEVSYPLSSIARRIPFCALGFSPLPLRAISFVSAKEILPVRILLPFLSDSQRILQIGMLEEARKWGVASVS
jgi:hypothetical protein